MAHPPVIEATRPKSPKEGQQTYHVALKKIILRKSHWLIRARFECLQAQIKSTLIGDCHGAEFRHLKIYSKDTHLNSERLMVAIPVPSFSRNFATNSNYSAFLNGQGKVDQLQENLRIAKFA